MSHPRRSPSTPTAAVSPFFAAIVRRHLQAAGSAGTTPASVYISNEVREVAGEAVAAITVQDSGIGIDPAHLKQVFDPFFTTKGNHRGTGLGLAVSYGIVREHSGTMGVESEPGQGTSFSIELPLARKPIHA